MKYFILAVLGSYAMGANGVEMNIQGGGVAPSSRARGVATSNAVQFKVDCEKHDVKITSAPWKTINLEKNGHLYGFRVLAQLSDVAPTSKPIASCGRDSKEVKIWDSILLANGKYYNIVGPLPDACTPDLNSSGVPSSCQCPKGYTYIAPTCERNGTVKPTGRCTRDFNEFNHSSFCECPTFHTYNSESGRCEQ